MMSGFNLPIVRNPLKTKSDVQEAVRQLCEPLKPHYSSGCALLRLGNTCTNYGERRCEMEAFARPFWGLVPLAAGGGESDLWNTCRTGLINGTNPAHPEYWGDLTEVDQLAVEMPPLALGLLLAKNRLWDPLSGAEKKQIVAWLDQINHHTMSDNNWRAFPVLVNVALKKLGAPYNAEVLETGLKRLDDFYLADGWYSDGGPNTRRDYYIPFAMQYYTSIYAHLMGDEDPKRAAIYRERTAAFAQDFIHWFTADGAALPFGRSLTYRFAQGAFWGALAFADVEALPWGVIKGLYLRHLRWWFKQPIFTPDGLLSIGYSYPNLMMSEFYNGPGSPYWAMKAFLPLALPDDHPFWRAKEEALPALDSHAVQKHPYMIMGRSPSGNHLTALTSGQWCGYDFGHTAEKYSKFAYSTHFGFSIARESTGLTKGAYDSMLALSDGKDQWRVRQECEEFKITGDTIYSRWKPWADVEVQTWLRMDYPWHIRMHRIKTARVLETAEGGFAIPRHKGVDAPVDTGAGSDRCLSVHPEYGGSGICNLLGERQSRLVEPFPNTNLMSPRTVIPSLIGHLEPGEHWLACVVIGDPSVDEVNRAWVSPPSAKSLDDVITVHVQ
jgi:hypothetical protein